MKLRTRLKNQAKLLKPIMRVGKNGLTEGVINEILRQLKKNKLIKIKFLKNFIENKDKKSIALLLKKKTCSEIIDIVGNVIVLYKPPSLEKNLNKKNKVKYKR